MSVDKAHALSPEPFRKAIPSRPQHGGNGILAGLMTRPWFPWQRHSKTGRGCGVAVVVGAFFSFSLREAGFVSRYWDGQR